MTTAVTNPSALRSALSPRHQRRGPCPAPTASPPRPNQPGTTGSAPPGHACRSRGQPLSPPRASVSPAAARPGEAAGAPLCLSFPCGYHGDGVGGPGVHLPSQTIPPAQGVASTGPAVSLRPVELITPVRGGRCHRRSTGAAAPTGLSRGDPVALGGDTPAYWGTGGAGPAAQLWHSSGVVWHGFGTVFARVLQRFCTAFCTAFAQFFAWFCTGFTWGFLHGFAKFGTLFCMGLAQLSAQFCTGLHGLACVLHRFCMGFAVFARLHTAFHRFYRPFPTFARFCTVFARFSRVLHGFPSFCTFSAPLRTAPAARPRLWRAKGAVGVVKAGGRGHTRGVITEWACLWAGPGRGRIKAAAAAGPGSRGGAMNGRNGWCAVLDVRPHGESPVRRDPPVPCDPPLPLRPPRPLPGPLFPLRCPRGVPGFASGERD